MTCIGDEPGGEDRPAQNVQPDLAKVRGRSRASVAQRCRTGSECNTYCAECQLWPSGRRSATPGARWRLWSVRHD